MAENEKAAVPSVAEQLRALLKAGKLNQKEYEDLALAILGERGRTAEAAVESAVENKDREIHRLKAGKTALRDTNRMLSMVLDEKVAEAAKVQEIRRSDAMTGLLNRVGFQEDLERALATEHRGRWLVVGFVDITSFKWYNDNLGHPVGDEIIKTVALILRSHIRDSDFNRTARLGGDEFGFYIVGFPSSADAVGVANRLKNAISSFKWDGLDPGLAEMPVSADIGVVCLRLGPVEERKNVASLICPELIAEADKQMYAAKQDKAPHVLAIRKRWEDGALVPIPDEEDWERKI